MNKIFNLTSTFKAAEADDGSVMIRGMASTADFDRAGDTISAEAWTKGGLQNFEKNPIILFNHDYDRPIGRATGMKAGPNGLELECKISKNAPGNVAALVKDGVLGAFSVGFKVKDADYIKETDGLMIKDAELFEVSVVSVPCNQSATFSLAKSFDSTTEYEEFKKTFTNRVDLAGQSLAKDEAIASNIASDHTPKSAELISADQEIKMDNQNIDLEAFAKKVAEDTAAKIAMKLAEQKAADVAQAKAVQEAEAAKAAEGVQIKSVIESGITSGVEALQADMEKSFETAKGDEISALVKKYEAQVSEKSAELEAMRNSKMEFSKSGSQKSMSDFGQEYLNAEILGKITGKGWDTAYAKDVMEKTAAVVPSALNVTTVDFSLAYTDAFEQAVGLETKVGGLFREVEMQSNSLVIPFLGEVNPATFSTTTGLLASANSLELTGVSDDDFDISNKILIAERLVAGTYIDNNIDEGQIISFLPMINAAIARAHGQAIDTAILYGTAGSTAGLLDAGGTKTTAVGSYDGSGTKVIVSAAQADGTTALTAAELNVARGSMGVHGIDPAKLAYVINSDAYYDLLLDGEFQDVTDVGGLATKVTGQVGMLFGSPVIVSDQIPNGADAKSFGVIVNTDSALIGRLRGVSLETEYKPSEQRTAIIASQSLGFKTIQGATSSIGLHYLAN